MDRGAAGDWKWSTLEDSCTVGVPHESNSIYLDGFVSGRLINFIVDSGAAATIISKDFWDSLPEGNRPQLWKSSEQLVFADGDSHAIEGRCILPLSFGSTRVNFPVIIAELGVMGLLGNDFMRTHSCVLDFNRKCISINGQELYYREEQHGSWTGRIKVAQTCTIPAGHEILIKGKIMKHKAGMQVGAVEACGQFTQKHGLLLGRTLVQANNSCVPVRIMNPTNETKVLHKDTVVGLIHPVLDVQQVEIPDKQSQKDDLFDNQISSFLPDYLKDLYERSCFQLTPDQCKKVENLLRENSDIFSSSDEDIGRTNIVKHHIVTGNARPVKQPPRRLPVHQRSEADAQTKSMLDRGIIQPSSSPWASPIVMVKKM